MNKFHYHVMLLILAFGASHAVAKEWNGIVPCVSTRSGAETILGRQKKPDFFNIYFDKKDRVTVFYKQVHEKKPDTDIVKMIVVRPAKTVRLDLFVKNVSNFKQDFRKTQEDEKVTRDYSAYYTNANEGFVIGVHNNEKDEEVILTFWYIARKDNPC